MRREFHGRRGERTRPPSAAGVCVARSRELPAPAAPGARPSADSSPLGEQLRVVPHHVERETANAARQLTATGARPRGFCHGGDAGVRPADGRAVVRASPSFCVRGETLLLSWWLNHRSGSVNSLPACCVCGPPRPRAGAGAVGFVLLIADSRRAPRCYIEDWRAPGEEISFMVSGNSTRSLDLPPSDRSVCFSL